MIRFSGLNALGKLQCYYVFMIPVANELDLKKCAASVNEKSIEMEKFLINKLNLGKRKKCKKYN